MKTLLATVLILTVALGSPVFAKKKATPAPSTEPRIVEINALSITVSIGTSGDDHKTYKISKSTKITLNGSPATTDNLLAGMLAKVTEAEGDATTAAAIDAKDAPKH